jgi:hypothetical protein
MTDATEIYRAANQLLQQYGHAARLHAEERADVLLAAGDLDGSRTWRRVTIAITTLSAPQRNATHAGAAAPLC